MVGHFLCDLKTVLPLLDQFNRQNQVVSNRGKSRPIVCDNFLELSSHPPSHLLFWHPPQIQSSAGHIEQDGNSEVLRLPEISSKNVETVQVVLRFNTEAQKSRTLSDTLFYSKVGETHIFPFKMETLARTVLQCRINSENEHISRWRNSVSHSFVS